MDLEIVVQHPEMSRLRVPLALKEMPSHLLERPSILICRKIPSEMEGVESFFLFFADRTNKNRTETCCITTIMDHHIQIINQDREYSNVDVHEQSMLSTKAEERPTGKPAESKMLVRCILGNA